MKQHKAKSIYRNVTLLMVFLLFITISSGWAQSRQLLGSNTELKPWLHVLTAEQALSAEVSENKLIFPKEGNSWLSEVELHHVLWSSNAKDFDHNFAVRIVKIDESSGNIVFQTDLVGFPVIYSGFRDEVKNPDPSVKKLVNILPSELPGFQTRGFIKVAKVNETGKAYAMVYSGVEGALHLSIGPFSEKSFNKIKETAENAPKEVDIKTKQYEGGTLMIVQSSLTTRVHLFLDGMEMRSSSRKISAERLYTILEALNIKELEKLIVAVNN